MPPTTPGPAPDTTSAPVGRRERKKAATRKAIADAALRLFLERGYDAVGIREIADAADVSTTTLFKHFPVKEALVFDEDDDQEERLLAAVRERPAGTSVPAALREHALASRLVTPNGDDRLTAFLNLVATTPALRDYGQNMWLRHHRPGPRHRRGKRPPRRRPHLPGPGSLRPRSPPRRIRTPRPPGGDHKRLRPAGTWMGGLDRLTGPDGPRALIAGARVSRRMGRIDRVRCDPQRPSTGRHSRRSRP